MACVRSGPIDRIGIRLGNVGSVGQHGNRGGMTSMPPIGAERSHREYRADEQDGSDERDGRRDTHVAPQPARSGQNANREQANKCGLDGGCKNVERPEGFGRPRLRADWQTDRSGPGPHDDGAAIHGDRRDREERLRPR